MRAFFLRRVCAAAAAIAVGLLQANTSEAQVQRALGIDVSAWQGNISQATWDTFYSTANRTFAFLRASRGGTTGYYNQNDANNNNGLNTLSQRYDDPYFIQNITRATKAGILTGSYHFNRADITASTLNSNGIANTGPTKQTTSCKWLAPGCGPDICCRFWTSKPGPPNIARRRSPTGRSLSPIASFKRWAFGRSSM